MAFGTGGGSDTQKNKCGIAMGHAYTLIGVFTMKDAKDVSHECLLVRNPWGHSGYSAEWNDKSKDWTDALVK